MEPTPTGGTPRRAAPTAGADDRAPQVRAMFDQLAPKYDLANRVLSLGLDQWWRRQALAALKDNARGEVLDLCAGTLDFTVALVRGGATHVHAVDFAGEMLEAGRAKLPPGAPVTITRADARELPLPAQSVDGIICGFGLRNVPELHRAIAECARVLRPGGRLVVLDFFQPEGTVSRLLQDSYNRLVVPTVGGMVTGFRDAYAYLTDSIDAFQTRPQFEAMLTDFGFVVRGREMVPPVASMIVGIRQEATVVTAIEESGTEEDA
ncbi:MAG: ubiquinone/menaquinone biosynthesis methyltransferase [Alphaproteobacteria bacterium]|nr:ubiquinone/menaquinone biosynthesis methyltransferase [Alphaproteobacteria bacterium]